MWESRDAKEGRRPRRISSVLGWSVLLIILVGCSRPGSDADGLTESQAVEIAENALVAYNLGFAVWSCDWSQTMKAAIDEAAFTQFREQALAQLGEYLAINAVPMEPAPPHHLRH
jgi:hypothetical protein